MAFPENAVLSPQFFLTELGDKLALAFAIILIPDGVALEDKVIEDWVNKIEFNLDIETALKVVEDFFDCTQISLLLKQFTETVVKVSTTISQVNLPEETGSPV